MLDMHSEDFDAYTRLNGLLAGGRLRFACAHGSKNINPAETDVVALSVPGDMSGTGAMLLVKVAERGLFTRAEDITLNGLHGFIGPAPNERLGVVDVLVTGGMVADNNPQYTGMDFFEDLLNDREVDLQCLSQEHTHHAAKSHLSMMGFARMTVYDMPLDPELARLAADTLFVGNSVYLNGGRSVVLGSGAYGTEEEPTISCACDCFIMDKSLMLPKTENVPARHSMTMLLPLWKNYDVKALCRRVEQLASSHSADEAQILSRCEQRMIGAATGGMAFVDPGPKPYRNVFTA